MNNNHIKTVLCRHFLCAVDLKYLIVQEENEWCVKITQSPKFFKASIERSLNPKKQGKSILDIAFPSKLWITNSVKEAKRISTYHVLRAYNMPVQGIRYYIIHN